VPAEPFDNVSVGVINCLVTEDEADAGRGEYTPTAEDAACFSLTLWLAAKRARMRQRRTRRNRITTTQSRRRTERTMEVVFRGSLLVAGTAVANGSRVCCICRALSSVKGEVTTEVLLGVDGEVSGNVGWTVVTGTRATDGAEKHKHISM